MVERPEGIDYADDLCLLSNKLTDTKEMLEELTIRGRKVSLKINGM